MDRAFRILRDEIWSLYQWIFLFLPGRAGHKIRGYCLRPFFKKAGKNITIKENVEIHHPWNLIMGSGSGFGRNNIIDCVGGVVVGENVRFGPNVMVATMNHSTRRDGMTTKNKQLKKVVVGDNVWVGHGVTILPGVEIGSNVIVAAGAVVSKNIRSGSVVAGVPAKDISK